MYLVAALVLFVSCPLSSLSSLAWIKILHLSQHIFACRPSLVFTLSLREILGDDFGTFLSEVNGELRRNSGKLEWCMKMLLRNTYDQTIVFRWLSQNHLKVVSVHNFVVNL